MEIYGKKIHLKPFDLFFIPPNVSMRYYPDESEPWCYIWFEFYGTRAEMYRKKMGFTGKNAVKTGNNSAAAYDEVCKLLSQLNQNAALGYYTCLSLFYRIMDTLNASENRHSRDLKEQILTYIDCHYHDPDLKIEHICRDFNISHSYLCKLFKGGETVKPALIRRRMMGAKELLLTTDLNIAEVGYSIGYTDNAHFMKCFKKHFGLSASRYRKINIPSKTI